MIVKPVKTDKILPAQKNIFEVLRDSLPTVQERSIIAITSKIISLCEGRVIATDDIDKEELLRQEAEYYLPPSLSKYGYHFSIKDHSLTSFAGIDESNSSGDYVLWPKDSQDSANKIRKYLKDTYNLKHVGVVITDSTSTPMRWGTVGTALGFSGFNAIHNYTGEPDLFDRKLTTSQAGIATGLAATAVLMMGEGAEQTPIVLIEDLPFVQFQDHEPTKEELELFYIKHKEDDLFAPFLTSVNWQKGNKQAS